MSKLTEVLFEHDADVSILRDRYVAIVGGGAMGHAQALCLRESGVRVVLGLAQDDPGAAHARALGFEVLPVVQACEESDTIVLLEADQNHRETYASVIAPNVVPGDVLIFGSGFNVAFGFITPDPRLDVALVAPQATPSQVREEFTNGRGVPMVVAVFQDASGSAQDVVAAYAKALGGLRAGAVKTTVQQYTSAQVFGSHAIADGVLAATLAAAIDTLTAAGVEDTIAFLTVVQHAQLSLAQWLESGVLPTRTTQGDWALYTASATGRHVVTQAWQEQLQAVLKHISSGTLARQFLADAAADGPLLRTYQAASQDHPIDRVTAAARDHFGAATVRVETEPVTVW